MNKCDRCDSELAFANICGADLCSDCLNGYLRLYPRDRVSVQKDDVVVHDTTKVYTGYCVESTEVDIKVHVR